MYNLCFVQILKDLCNSGVILANIYTPINTHTDFGRVWLEKQSNNIQWYFVPVTCMVCFSKISKSWTNGIFTLTEMHKSSMPRQWKSQKLIITQRNSLKWHRYISKLDHTIYLHNKCIVYILFFSKWGCPVNE